MYKWNYLRTPGLNNSEHCYHGWGGGVALQLSTGTSARIKITDSQLMWPSWIPFSGSAVTPELQTRQDKDFGPDFNRMLRFPSSKHKTAAPVKGLKLPAEKNMNVRLDSPCCSAIALILLIHGYFLTDSAGSSHPNFPWA